MDLTEIIIAILRWTAFAVWFVFLAWFGTRRRWEETPYGVNTFLVSLAVAATWGLLALYTLNPDLRVIRYGQVVVTIIVIWTGIQRIRFLYHERRFERRSGQEV